MVPVVVGEDLTALRMVHRLQEEGVFVNCVLSPATPPGRALIRTFDHVPQVERAVPVVRSGFRLASGDPAPATPPPVLGADTGKLLAELGYSAAEIDGFRSRKVI